MPAAAKRIAETKNPWYAVEKTDATIILRFGGMWKAIRLEGLENRLANSLRKDISVKNNVKIILEKDFAVDSAGACLIANGIQSLVKRKIAVDESVFEQNTLLQRFLENRFSVRPVDEGDDKLVGWLNRLGYRTCSHGKKVLSLLAFLGKVLVTWFGALHSPRKFRWVSVFRQGEEIGVRALPIIGLISFLIGMVLAYQGINQLSRFGAQLYTVDFLGVGLLREIAVLITAIVIAGRSGSAFTAQIGSMALNQEIDAVRMLGLDPVVVLVIPRLLAILVCLPLLVFFAMITGLFGGMVMVNAAIDVSPLQFVHQLQKAVTPATFWVGMSKAPLFAIIIGLVGCYRGFQVKGSAESVGRQTTQAVVESIFLVIVMDAFMSILFSWLKV